MYERASRRTMYRPRYIRVPNQGLGFTLPNFLLPPKSVRQAIGGVVGAIETEAATALERLGQRLKPPPPPLLDVNQAVNQAGGWGNVALWGGGALLLVMLLRKR